MKDRVLKKMFEISKGKMTLINFNCQLFPEFSKEISEIDFRTILKDLEKEGFIEILSGFKTYTTTTNNLLLLNLTKEGVAYINVMGGVYTFEYTGSKVLKSISVLSGGKPSFKINVNSDLLPVFKTKLGKDSLNNILIQLNHDKYIKAAIIKFKGVSYVVSLNITDIGLSLVNKVLT